MADKPLCKIEDCGKPVRTRGWCSAHYWRWHRHGDPLAGAAPRGVISGWIAENIAKAGNDCIFWPFSKYTSGYGKLKLGRSTVSAHRYICELFNGSAPSPDHEAAHSCGQGKNGCINPNHLRWATSVENEADKVGHGTVPIGERNGAAKLTRADILSIRSLQDVACLEDIANRFGISKSAVSLIHKRKRWAWLE